MRVARIKETAGGYYHVISRVVDRRMVLDDKEKERFCRLMRQAAFFSGVQVLTFAVLNNHFHILLHVSAPRLVDPPEFLRRFGALYGRPAAEQLAAEIRRLKAEGQAAAADALQAPYLARMHDLSGFMKTLKQRFTQSFNQRHDRKGTLWEERFKSILIEGQPGALSAVAAYIDLNAVRAGIVADPGAYRFCGYGAALGGAGRARRGLQVVLSATGRPQEWAQAHDCYRQLLYVSGQARGVTATGRPVRPGFAPERVRQVLEQGGALSLTQALHCRVRYFSDGLVLGGQAYVDDAFLRFRDRFGRQRTSGARRMRGAAWPELFTARRLRLNVITVPAS